MVLPGSFRLWPGLTVKLWTLNTRLKANRNTPGFVGINMMITEWQVWNKLNKVGLPPRCDFSLFGLYRSCLLWHWIKKCICFLFSLLWSGFIFLCGLYHRRKPLWDPGLLRWLDVVFMVKVINSSFWRKKKNFKMYIYVSVYMCALQKLGIYQYQLSETSFWSGGKLKREQKLLLLLCNCIELPCSSGCHHTS